MTKRYQVFVSSTYEDLINERLEVMKALLELNCIPCGMEYFPAANEDQWTFITNLIDTCDYYIVIIGGQYGTEDSAGKSYTQKEYEYALSKKIPTIGFIHYKRDSLPPEKREEDKNKRLKLEKFIALVRTKLCKEWRNADNLGAVVSRSLTQLTTSNPRTGWVRADKVASEELLGEINVLVKEAKSLKMQIAKFENDSSIQIDIKNIAFEEEVEIYGTFSHYRGGTYRNEEWKHKTTWKDLFKLISPYLLKWDNERILQNQFATSIIKEKYSSFTNEIIDKDVLQSVKVQFLALGLIKVNAFETVRGGTALFWTLTQKGESIMLNERSVKKKTK